MKDSFMSYAFRCVEVWVSFEGDLGPEPVDEPVRSAVLNQPVPVIETPWYAQSCSLVESGTYRIRTE